MLFRWDDKSCHEESIDGNHQNYCANKGISCVQLSLLTAQHVAEEHKEVADDKKEHFVEIVKFEGQGILKIGLMIQEDHIEERGKHENLDLNAWHAHKWVRDTNKGHSAYQKGKWVPFDSTSRRIETQIKRSNFSLHPHKLQLRFFSMHDSQKEERTEPENKQN